MMYHHRWQEKRRCNESKKEEAWRRRTFITNQDAILEDVPGLSARGSADP
jgi:hypothetical protein